MNRRQKIIVSVTGIFIVLLVLLGLTYAYFLTRITGNSNPTSISVTTAKLELVYGDGTTSILTSATPIEPGKFSSSKDFTVTNNGNALTDYAVTLEDFSITYAADTVIDGVSVKAGTVTKMEYPSDMKMTITCVIESDDENRNGQACGNTNGTLPTENSILLTNSIEVDDVHKYVLTLTYVDSGIDQSKDMNKTIKGKIDIIDPKSTIDLEGSVASYQTGDYVEINSTPIKSEIVDGKYKIIGVEPGSHTLNVKYKDASGNIQTRGSQTLTIKKGEEISVNGNTVTFTDASRSVTVDIDSSYGITVDETVKSSLRDAIIANAISGKNGTEFVESPPTKIAEEKSLTKFTGEYETKRYYYSSWEEGSYEWPGLTYGSTQNEASGTPNEITEGASSIETCNSVKGQYISDSINCFYDGCDSIGKVVDCESDGTPILEENDNYTSWEEGGYEWPGLTYGSTQNEASGTPNEITEGASSIETCNSVKGQYISDVINCNYDGCDSIGKVVDCENDGTPILEDNYYERKEEIMLYEKVLSTTPDNYGTSYYYRGDVEDNYVTFSNKCWRIVRIQGDGSIKLILESQSPCSENMTSDYSLGRTNWGYKIENDKYIGDYKNSTSGMKNKLTTWLNATDDNGERINITTKAEELLKTEEWCLGNTTNTYAYYSPYGELGTTAAENYTAGTNFHYETGRNLLGKGVTPNATLKCNGETDSSKIGTLTADEVAFAGGKVDENNTNYYLYKRFDWWTLSRVSFYQTNDKASRVSSFGGLYGDGRVDNDFSVRPAVSLNTNVKITSGEGTLEKPYIIG